MNIFFNLPEEHSTPESSPWEQSWFPQPLKWHSSMLFSYPVQLTLSIHICAVAGALPNAAPETPTAPSLFATKQTFKIKKKKEKLHDVFENIL